MLQRLVILNLCLAQWLSGCTGDPSGNAPSAFMDRPELPRMAVTVKRQAERPEGARCWLVASAPTSPSGPTNNADHVTASPGQSVRAAIAPLATWAMIEPGELRGQGDNPCWLLVSDLDIGELTVSEATEFQSMDLQQKCKLPAGTRIRFGSLLELEESGPVPPNMQGRDLLDLIIDITDQTGATLLPCTLRLGTILRAHVRYKK